MFEFPPIPAVPPGQTAHSQGQLRYEDVCQDGRLMPTSLSYTLGIAVWQQLLAHHPINLEAIPAGVVPILTRLVVEGGGGPVSMRRPLELLGGFQLAHTRDSAGAPSRIIMNIWADVQGHEGRVPGMPRPETDAPVFLGRAFAEHVFTRLHAPKEQRKVLRLEFDGLPAIPPDEYRWRPPEELLELPAGATPLDEGLVPDEATIAFGLTHTDYNQHVNSLVYPRLFEEAALRRFSARGRGTRLLLRFAELAYRKPCFAGDRMRVHLQAFELGGLPGAVGVYLPADGGAAGATPHVFLRVMYGP